MGKKTGKTNYDPQLVKQFHDVYPETKSMSAATLIDYALRWLILEGKKEQFSKVTQT